MEDLADLDEQLARIRQGTSELQRNASAEKAVASSTGGVGRTMRVGDDLSGESE